MRYQSTVFAQLLKAVPRGWFERAVQQHKTGRAKRELSDWGHVVTMVLAQLSGARSLRDLERIVERHPGVLPHLGLAGVRRSTLCDANASRPAGLFEAVAGRLSAALAGKRTGKEALRLIDATRIFAGKHIEVWAKGGVKLHMTFDPNAERPTWFAVTSERVHDLTPLRAMPIEAGATYVFDKGYYDFAFWASLHDASCRFVTRLKRNSPIRTLRERKPKGEGILFDRIVRLSERLASQRRNPFSAKVRLVGVTIEGGREITLLTNDLAAPATEIAALYKARWQIELFFKWLKQNLKIAHFLGTSKNAVSIQIMAALIAFLLLRIASLRHGTSLGLQAIARLMPATLLSRRPFDDLLKPIPKQTSSPAITPQIEFAYA
jgi:hypothetical protein